MCPKFSASISFRIWRVKKIGSETQKYELTTNCQSNKYVEYSCKKMQKEKGLNGLKKGLRRYSLGANLLTLKFTDKPCFFITRCTKNDINRTE